MYKSFKVFNKDIPMFCCDFYLSDYEKNELKKIGVNVIKNNLNYKIKDGRCYDLVLIDFLKELNWEKLIWVDADTLFLDSIDEILSLNYDFVGHPGRNKNGLILTPRQFGYKSNNPDKNYYATGLWISNKKEILIDFKKEFEKNPNYGFDSITVTEIINEKYNSFQIDGNIYNFSRDLVCKAKYKNGKIFYELNNKIYYPKTVGFSAMDNGERGFSKNIDLFYKEVVEKLWKKYQL